MEKFRQNDKMYELITIEEEIKHYSDKTICKEIIKEEELIIPKSKPNIEQLAKVIIKPLITHHKIISTLNRPKVIFQGKIMEKIFFVADKPEQTIHAAKFSIPFCNFIRLPKKIDINEVKVNIEDVIIQVINKRKIHKCVLLLVCVIPDRKNYSDC